ncbi:response regulator transcription factor [Qipengyuania qiaonensis]|uniref:Response regulator n=1 Tax=Qipengyuania qiaonensis TaxID=2867240 RepID=A0ABS7JGB3_9SPHN|nr:response regulator [Qipengyuania qiaonensis]MBX7484077.1 response regulator [Qipengyuania qiaonensis]
MSRIIVAEDDELVGEIVRDTLIQAGHAVGVVESGADALSVIRAKRPDMVILDCNLPGMTGVQIVQQMRIECDLWDIPVLMLTARTSTTDEDLALYAGANDYMRKPFYPQQLVTTVNRILQEEQHRRDAGNQRTKARAI